MAEPHNQPSYYLLIILEYISAILKTYILSADIAAIDQARFNDRHFEVFSKKLYESSAFIYTVDKQDFRCSEWRIRRNMYPVVEKLVSFEFYYGPMLLIV